MAARTQKKQHEKQKRSRDVSNVTPTPTLSLTTASPTKRANVEGNLSEVGAPMHLRPLSEFCDTEEDELSSGPAGKKESKWKKSKKTKESKKKPAAVEEDDTKESDTKESAATITVKFHYADPEYGFPYAVSKVYPATTLASVVFTDVVDHVSPLCKKNRLRLHCKHDDTWAPAAVCRCHDNIIFHDDHIATLAALLSKVSSVSKVSSDQPNPEPEPRTVNLTMRSINLRGAAVRGDDITKKKPVV